jgi:protocatechuate 3,4-dioxygenase, beta subunit
VSEPADEGRDWGSHPPLLAPDYKSTRKRAPQQPLVRIHRGASERTGPSFADRKIAALESDLTRNARRNGEPLGERIIVTGHVLDEDGRPQPRALVEIWQANAAGRYIHAVDQHAAPIDPNFLGSGRCLTDEAGVYSFTTVKPGAYPWSNHANAWRPNHIHFSLFGRDIAARLVTQMYFPGDPLLALDPIFLAVPQPARERLIARFSLEVTRPDFALGYVFDIVLRGRRQTPFEA